MEIEVFTFLHESNARDIAYIYVDAIEKYVVYGKSRFFATTRKNYNAIISNANERIAIRTAKNLNEAVETFIDVIFKTDKYSNIVHELDY